MKFKKIYGKCHLGLFFENMKTIFHDKNKVRALGKYLKSALIMLYV